MAKGGRESEKYLWISLTARNWFAFLLRYILSLSLPLSFISIFDDIESCAARLLFICAQTRTSPLVACCFFRNLIICLERIVFSSAFLGNTPLQTRYTYIYIQILCIINLSSNIQAVFGSVCMEDMTRKLTSGKCFPRWTSPTKNETTNCFPREM